MTLNAKTVEAAIVERLDGNGWDEVEYEFRNDFLLRIGEEDYPIKVVSMEDGSEGDWSVQTEVIIRVGSQLFRKTGHYQSHYGNDWDGPFDEVIEATKTVTVYETADNSPISLDEIDEALQGVYSNSAMGTLHIRHMAIPYVRKEYIQADDDYSGVEYLIVEIQDKLYRKTGYWTSHGGTDWTGPTVQVKPVEIKVTKYTEV